MITSIIRDAYWRVYRRSTRLRVRARVRAFVCGMLTRPVRWTCTRSRTDSGALAAGVVIAS